MDIEANEKQTHQFRPDDKPFIGYKDSRNQTKQREKIFIIVFQVHGLKKKEEGYKQYKSLKEDQACKTTQAVNYINQALEQPVDIGPRIISSNIGKGIGLDNIQFLDHTFPSL